MMRTIFLCTVMGYLKSAKKQSSDGIYKTIFEEIYKISILEYFWKIIEKILKISISTNCF